MGLSSLRRHYPDSPSAPTPAAPRSYSAADHAHELTELRRQLRQERDDELQKIVTAHQVETAPLHARIAELEAELAMVSARTTLPDGESSGEQPEPLKYDPEPEPKHDPGRPRRGR